MKWLIKMAWREARFTRFRGIVMLFSMVFGLTVLVSFSSIKQGFYENFYSVATVLTGGDLRVEILGKPTERMARLLPRLGDERHAYWGTTLQLQHEGVNKEATVWFFQPNPSYPDELDESIRADWPEAIEFELFLTKEQEGELFGDNTTSSTVSLGHEMPNLLPAWEQHDSEVLPLWIKRIKRDQLDRIVANTELADKLVWTSDLEWEQVWTYHFEGNSAKERIARAKYILGYLQEESQGVRFIYELPDETGFYHSFRLISNTLFLAAFSALMLGTLAYTVTFVDFSRGKTTIVALLRCLGSTTNGSWGVYGIQIVIYALLSVLLAGVFSVGIQLLLPVVVKSWTGIELNIEIYWRALLVSLGFGGCFILLPGFIAIMQLVNCEPIEVLRSVKMPARRIEVRWIQSIMATVTFLLAVGFCLQMVEDYWFAVVYLFAVGIVFALLVLGVLGLRKAIRRLTEIKRSYPVVQASANLFRTENQYVFTLTSISFGLFLISFLFMFFEGFAKKGIHDIAGYGSISDERIGTYLDWLQHVFFINQWMGVTLLVIGVLAVFVLLTSQRRTRLYEAVVLETLGADGELIRKIMILESIFAGSITALLGIVGGVVFGCIVIGLFMHIPIAIPFFGLSLLFLGTVGVMILMGFVNMKGIIGYPPLEVLRRRRHFSNW